VVVDILKGIGNKQPALLLYLHLLYILLPSLKNLENFDSLLFIQLHLPILQHIHHLQVDVDVIEAVVRH
jgi:hypothetical protein